MKLKKQKIGYWISTFLIDVGVILLVQSGYESRVYWLHRCVSSVQPFCCRVS